MQAVRSNSQHIINRFNESHVPVISLSVSEMEPYVGETVPDQIAAWSPMSTNSDLDLSRRESITRGVSSAAEKSHNARNTSVEQDDSDTACLAPWGDGFLRSVPFVKPIQRMKANRAYVFMGSAAALAVGAAAVWVTQYSALNIARRRKQRSPDEARADLMQVVVAVFCVYW